MKPAMYAHPEAPALSPMLSSQPFLSIFQICVSQTTVSVGRIRISENIELKKSSDLCGRVRIERLQIQHYRSVENSVGRM